MSDVCIKFFWFKIEGGPPSKLCTRAPETLLRHWWAAKALHRKELETIEYTRYGKRSCLALYCIENVNLYRSGRTSRSEVVSSAYYRCVLIFYQLLTLNTVSLLKPWKTRLVIIFAMLNPQKIWHEHLTDISTSHVRCSHFTLRNPKKSFFNIIILILFGTRCIHRELGVIAVVILTLQLSR